MHLYVNSFIQNCYIWCTAGKGDGRTENREKNCNKIIRNASLRTLEHNWMAYGDEPCENLGKKCFLAEKIPVLPFHW